MCINGIFGPVCDDMWNNIAAELVCSQLGGPSNGEFLIIMIKQLIFVFM